MMFRGRQLEVFRAVMDAGSITEAARLLHISQPAVSKMLQQAETQLGFRLFLREQGRIRPTSEARSLLPEIMRAFAAIEGVQRLADDLKEARSGVVAVAATPSLANGLLIDAVGRLRAHRPRLRVALHSMLNHEVVEMVADRRVDLGLVLFPSEESTAVARDLCAADLVCVVPRGHALARRSSVGPADLQHWPLISFSQHLPIGALIEAAYRERGLRRTIAIDVTQSATACHLVAAGAGVAVLDAFALTEDMSELVVVPFVPSTRIVARLLRARHQPIPRIAAALVQELEQVVAEGVKGGKLYPVPQAAPATPPRRRRPMTSVPP
jgi:DNA-binding transcriptional LysR family regulator